MKNIIIKATGLALFISLTFVSCYKDDYLNPSQASNESVVSNTNGLIALCNGLQNRYSVGRQSPLYAAITASGLSTNELIVLNQGNTDEANLQAGRGNVLGNNAVVARLWEQSNIVNANADLILNNISKVGEPSTRNAILCYAHLFKGLALINLGTFWEAAPLKSGSSASFSPRAAVLAEAIKILEGGATAADGGPVFSTNFITGIDFKNTFAALLARAYTMVGNSDKAIEWANKVDLTKKSEFVYDDIARNPIFDVSYSNVNVCEPTDFNLGLSGVLAPSATDGRVLFFVKSKTFTTTLNEGKGFFTSNSARIPLYQPGEVILIKAEAVTELNKVLTKTNDIYGVNAGLPAYSGANTQAAILIEIFRNRCIELYNSGLKLDDSRRFGQAGPKDAGSIRNRNFYPYPNSERDNNPNTPADPEI